MLLSTTSHPLPPTSASHLCLPPHTSPSQVLRKGGMNPGDAIIITKGVGTGTILAADMRVEADAAWMSYVLNGLYGNEFNEFNELSLQV